MRKLLLLIRKGSPTESLFTDDHDGKYKEHLVLACKTCEVSGTPFALVRRIPIAKSPGQEQRSHQTWWIAHIDIAAVFEFDGSNMPIGFVPEI